MWHHCCKNQRLSIDGEFRVCPCNREGARFKSAHGHLVCSFVNPEEILRNPEEANKETSGEEDAVNDAKLPAGRFWVYHRCWTKASSESERERRRKIQSVAAESIQARDAKVLTLTDDSTNVAEKVVSYAQAAKSMNDYRTSGYQEALYIPLYDDQVLDLAPDCIVSSRGSVYRPRDRQTVEKTVIDQRKYFSALSTKLDPSSPWIYRPALDEFAGAGPRNPVANGVRTKTATKALRAGESPNTSR